MEYKKISLLFITSILVYSLVFDLSYINIFNIDWLYSNGEYQTAQIAFEFYKNEKDVYNNDGQLRIPSQVHIFII